LNGKALKLDYSLLFQEPILKIDICLNPFGPTLKLFQSSKMERAIANFVNTIILMYTGELLMFRSKVFEPTLTGISYRIFIEDLKSAVTKAAYTFAIQKYMKYLKIDNPDD